MCRLAIKRYDGDEWEAAGQRAEFLPANPAWPCLHAGGHEYSERGGVSPRRYSVIYSVL